MREAWTDSRRK